MRIMKKQSQVLKSYKPSGPGKGGARRGSGRKPIRAGEGTYSLQVQISESERVEVESAAAVAGVSPSAYGRQAIREKLERGSKATGETN